MIFFHKCFIVGYRLSNVGTYYLLHKGILYIFFNHTSETLHCHFDRLARPILYTSKRRNNLTRRHTVTQVPLTLPRHINQHTDNLSGSYQHYKYLSMCKTI